MAASVLNSKRAVEVSVFVVRAFVKLRSIISEHRELAAKLDQLERKLGQHDEDIIKIFSAINRLMAPPDKTARQIGFLNKLQS